MAKLAVLGTIFFLTIIRNGCGWNVTWEPYSEDDLPPMYDVDDYSKCEERKGLFCKVEIFLRPKDPDSSIARQIRKSYQYAYRFYRSSVFRMMCVDDQKANQEGVQKYVKTVMSTELERYNVSVEVPKYVCDWTLQGFNVYDYIIVVTILSYLWLVYHSTQYDWKRCKNPNFPKSKYEKWFNTFSVLKNWNKAIAKSESSDFQKLKCIQGLRFYITIWVLMCHTKASIGTLFLDNPADFEEFAAHPLSIKQTQIDLYVIQIYLLLSTMLLTNQVYEIHRNHGYYSFGHCCNLYFNRITRFLPTMVVMILASVPGTKLMPRGTIFMDYIDMVLKGCSTNWWSTLLQMNYLHKLKDKCMPGTWYLSVDTFLYLTTIIIMYVHLKFKLNLKKVLLATFIGMSMNYSYIIYTHNLDMLHKPDIELTRRVFNSVSYQTLYLNPYSSWSTCCIGIAVGAIFYHIKNKEIKFNAMQQLIWTSTFTVTPIIVIIISFTEVRGMYKAIIGPFLKPTFALAFGILILGVSKGYGGFIKRILEWDFARKMGGFTFCTYVYHFFIIFGKGTFQRSLVHFSVSNAALYLIQDIAVSFLIGVLATVLTEMPGLALQKMYLPQIKKNAILETEKNGKKLE